MQKIAILALQSVVPFDLGVACDVFSRVKLANGESAYKVLVCASETRIQAGAFEIHAPHSFDEVVTADIVVVPGIEDIHCPIPDSVINVLKVASNAGALIASICTGTFVLAAAGLLDGRAATTHWAVAEELARRYPNVSVDPSVLFVDDGDVVTSAGASAGLDMCLHLVQRLHGQEIASHSARLAVAPLHRDGGQAQFIEHQMPSAECSLGKLFEWMLENLDRPLNVSILAARARMSTRTFARRFREQTGTTPIQWLLRFRIRRAQQLLETSAASIEYISAASGFESPVTFRTRFQSLIGLTPTAYRRRFGSAEVCNI
ncbi:GlxA family transcriptional regulator [Herbaspirillum sp. VT-16-41]|uniref:GlxA family transcriptional regulator n=1 Tax=Herbaspirillum sp. VT-16-41 TaxID=1953765 RepID=UPI0009809F3A|nr:helix-turn-helix domain-containing protein [Herbaspirillum sp. VT-16-41]ONN64959.1 AraC family transcriptional regulator [Herbaspirillum sp. VT-16-41]